MSVCFCQTHILTKSLSRFPPSPAQAKAEVEVKVRLEPPLTAEKAQYVVGGGNNWHVRIRSAPSTSAREIECKSPGSVVTSEGTVETGDGHKWIKLDGKPHYMMVYNSQDGDIVMTKKTPPQSLEYV